MDLQAIYDEAMKAAKETALKQPNDWYCGFAYVHLTDARTPFAKFVKKKGDRVAFKGYPKGVDLSVYPMLEGTPHAGTQSMTVKEATCTAFARVLQSHGIEAYMTSRPD